MFLKKIIRDLRVRLQRVRPLLLPAFPLPESCLIIAPHPDDEALWCGGLIRRMVERGREAHVVILTGSEKSLAEPDDVDVMAKLMEDFENKSLNYEDLVRLSLNQAHHFSWQKTALATIDVY